ncbi:MAG: hypothetical protein V4572_10420, partial [Bacteroidota bacterium]
MNKRQILIFRGSVFALIGIMILYSLLFKKMDEFGIIFGIIFIPIMAYMSYSCFNELKKTKKEDQIYGPPINSSIAEKISYY